MLQRLTKLSPNADHAATLIAELEHGFGIDIGSIVHDDALSSNQKLAKMRPLLLNAVERKFELDAGSLAPHFEGASSPEASKYGHTPSPSPMIFLTADEYTILSNCTGDNILLFAQNLSVNMSNVANSGDATQLSMYLLSAGAVGIGVAAAMFVGAVIVKVAAGMTLVAALSATLAASAPIVGVIIAGAVLLVAGLVLFFLSKVVREVYGMVVNQTTHDFKFASYPLGAYGELGNGLYIKHGQLPDCMCDLDASSNQINLAAQLTGNDGVQVYTLGTFFAEMVPNTAAWGTEGMLVFTASDTDVQPVVYFQDPLHSGDAAVNVAVVSPQAPMGDQATYYANLAKGSGTSATITTSDTQVTARISSSTRGTVAMLAIISPS